MIAVNRNLIEWLIDFFEIFIYLKIKIFEILLDQISDGLRNNLYSTFVSYTFVQHLLGIWSFNQTQTIAFES